MGQFSSFSLRFQVNLRLRCVGVGGSQRAPGPQSLPAPIGRAIWQAITTMPRMRRSRGRRGLMLACWGEITWFRWPGSAQFLAGVACSKGSHLFGCDIPSGRLAVSACHFGVGSASLGVASTESYLGGESGQQHRGQTAASDGASCLLRNVPEGRCDCSLARSAWDSVTPKGPARRVRCDSRWCAHRFDDWSDEIFDYENLQNLRCMISDLGNICTEDHKEIPIFVTFCATLGRVDGQKRLKAVNDSVKSPLVIGLETRRTFRRNTSGMSYARSYRTLRDVSFEGRFPRHFVPGYDRGCPSGTRWQTFRDGIQLARQTQRGGTSRLGWPLTEPISG
jgi:hypothetical protein